MEQSVGQRWMIAGTSATRVKVGRQVHWIAVIHCSVGDYEEDTLWNTKTMKRARLVKVTPAPITNPDAEGGFAKLDNRIVISGGTMSLKCHRQKNITSTNRLADPFFQRLIKENHMPEWKCACSRSRLIRWRTPSLVVQRIS